MPPKKNRGKSHFDPQDRYFLEAKKQGYRSRAAFKLIEIDQKYRIFRKGDRVLDLGAAPGGWSQVALAAVGPKGCVLGIDIKAIRGFDNTNITFIEGDIRDSNIVRLIHDEMDDADVVLSDMAPATTGIKFQDQLQSAELARSALKLAQQALKPGGHLIIKIFPGEELPLLKRELKALFHKIHEFSPEASRRTSNEVYLIAKGYKKT